MEAHPQQFSIEPWTVEDSTFLYMINRWGGGYFDANANGDLTCAPLQENGIPIVVRAFGSIEKTLLVPRVMSVGDHKLVRELIEIDQRISTEIINEAWHDLIRSKNRPRECSSSVCSTSMSKAALNRSSARSRRSYRAW